MLILAVDPGTASTGYAVIELTLDKKFIVKEYGVVTTSSNVSIEKRLEHIFGRITQLIKKFRPGEIVLEQIFFNTNNRTAIAVGQARGVCLLAAAQASLKVYEYTPLQVKQAVVGYGRAEKSQVQKMVQMILGLSKTPTPDDAADALALAICHVHSLGNRQILELSQ
jgi:crossover junction endodeoxyribonuclease RuvC